MRDPPAVQSFFGWNLSFVLFACLLFLCGAADADTRSFPGSGLLYSNDWDGGTDLGTFLALSECSGPYNARVCIPRPQNLTYTLTIPENVNISRVVSGEYILIGDGFTGSCKGDDVEYNSYVMFNGVRNQQCPFEEPLWDQWRFDMPISTLHSGVNIIEYNAYPWKLNSDLYGNTIYGGYTGVRDIWLTLVYSTPPPPKLTGLNLSPDLLLTGHDILIRPVVEGESPDWEITGITYMITDTDSGATDLYHEYWGKHDLVYRPAPGSHGEKNLTARLHVRDPMTGNTLFSEKSGTMRIYFEKGLPSSWTDDDGDNKPNWLEYWAEDGAVPLLTNIVRYNASGTGYGVSYGNGVIELEPLAATQHYNTPLVIPNTTLSPGGESFGGPTVTGIDCAAEVMAHEYYHNWVDTQWYGGGMFIWQQDSDFLNTPITYDNETMYFNDRLPDFYEQSVSFTDWHDFTDTYNLKTIKDDVYKFYGDQEYMAMRAGNGARGIAENDWAYPGKQAGNRTTISGINPPVFTTCIGTCDIYSPSDPSGSPSGTVESTDDLNGNGLYDHLIAGNDITVSREGMYDISAVLTGDRGYGPEVIDIQRNQSVFLPGIYPIPVAFSGKSISSAGIDGPYTVTLTWRHDYQENGVAPSVSWQTALYTATQFEPVSAVFTGNATAAPDGTDLRAVIPVTINVAGTYTVEGYLATPDGQVVTHAETTAEYPAGPGEAALVFDGNAIAAYHRDGTYGLTGFRILDDSGSVVARRPDAGTVAISVAEYGTQQAILTDSFTDIGGDLTGEGRYGVLSINTDINAPSTGNYYYSVSLYDAGNRLVQTISDVKSISTAGPQSIPLNFSGKMIYNSRINGSFSLRALEIYGPTGVDRRSLAYTTSAYEYTQFDQPSIVIAGNVTDEAVDLDSNGLFDVIRIGFDVEVGYTGCGTTGCSSTFPVSANLTGPGGAVISRRGSSPSLERYQTHHVTLDFAGTDINGTGIDGPYGVADLIAGFSYPSQYNKPYQTAAYDHTQFEPAAILAGFVTNESGFPVAGTRIGAYEQSGYTNAAGYYRLIYGESHTGGVWAAPPGSSGLEAGYEIRSVTPGATTICNFTLFDTAGLAGTVSAENGTLLATGFVTADGPSDKTFTLATWGNGSYAITGLKPGNYTIRYTPATGADIVGNRTAMALAPGEERSWNITSFNARALSGTVRDMYGDPVEGAEVSVTDGPVIITGSYAIDTDAAGAYAFPRLGPGVSTIYVEPPYDSGLLANTSTVTIGFSDTSASHDILMEPEHAAPEVWWPDIDPADGYVPLTVTFTDQSKGYPTAWFWDFGDGTNSTERNPSHTYTAAGTYTVALSISNAYGSDSYVFNDCISVTDPRIVLPSGRLEPAASGVFPLSAGDISDATKLRLDLRYDPAVIRLDGVSSASALVYAVDSTIDNTTGRADITIMFMSGMQNIADDIRLANLSFTATGSAGSSTLLSGVSADQISCAGGEGCWPGAPEILSNLSVIEGSIRVGAADPLPVAGFTASPRAGNAPLEVAFDSTTSDVVSPTAYLWSFGDGSTSPDASPTHTYMDPGFYDVILTVTNATGSDTLTRGGYISVSPAGSAETYAFVRSIGHEGSGSSGEAEFYAPEGVAVHPSGNLYVTDSGNSRVEIVSPDGRYIDSFGSEGTGDGQFTYMRGIAADPSGNVYVTDVAANRVQKFSASGTYLGQWGSVGSDAGQLKNPCRVAIDGDGNVYITELGNNRVQKFSPSGTPLGMWGSYGSADGQFTFPGGIAIDNASFIYTAEGFPNYRVQKFDPSGTFLLKWGGPGSGDGQFTFPAGIAVDSDGSIYVADSDNNRVQKFGSDGQYITQWGTGGTGTGQFTYPYDVALSSDDLVYVVDNENHRIQVFSRGSATDITALFMVNVTSGPAPLTVQFTDMSEGSPTSWTWDFGDGITESVQNPVHTYTEPGMYSVSLTISGPSGSDTRISLITVEPPVNDEENGPDGTDPSYDGNGDGIPDRAQDNVASFHTVAGSYVTIAVPLPATLSDVRSMENPSPADAPDSAAFPYGFFGFTISGLGPGESALVSLYLPPEAAPDTYFRYGPTPDNTTPHWYDFADDGETGASVSGPVITLRYRDGGRGDSDLSADGTIRDPGGPAVITNRPPVIDLVGDRTVAEGTALAFTVTASDPDGDSLQFTGTSPLPAGATFTGQEFSWTPGYDQAGLYPVTFSVSDPSGLTDEETITITVTDTNRPPEIDPIGDKTIAEGESLAFTVTASDPDGDMVVLSADSLPAGAGFTDGSFLWTPGYDQAGTYPVAFTVTDPSGLTATESIAISVSDVSLNDPPVLDQIGDRTVAEGEELKFTLSATDPEGDILTFSADPLPAGATLVLHEFSWTPTYHEAGSYTITFSVSDPSGLTDEETITITVTDTNRPPEIDPIGDKTIAEGESLAFTVTASDPDGDMVVLSADSLPAGAGFTDGSFLWTPGYDQAGTYPVAFTVTDPSGLTATESIAISVSDVSLNDPPVLDQIGDRTVAEGEELKFTLSATDPEGDILTFSGDPLPAGSTFTGQEFSWTPGYDQADTYPVAFTVTDPSGLTDEETVTITVTDTNRPPLIDPVGDKTIAEGESLAFTVTASDPDGDGLIVEAENLPPGAVFDDASCEFSWTPGAGQEGSYPITFIATDPGGLSGVDEMKIIVIRPDVNNAPVIAVPAGISGKEGELLTFTVSATDPDEDPVTLSAGPLPSGATFSDGEFHWIPAPGQAGSYEVIFTAADPYGLYDSGTTTLVVTRATAETWNVRIVPKTINLRSRGLFIAFITVPASYTTQGVHEGSVTCNGVSALRLIRHAGFPRVLGAVFKVSELNGVRPGKDVPLVVEGTLTHNGKEIRLSGTDTVRIISTTPGQKDDTEDILTMKDNRIFEKLFKNS
jgi:PKD repeat protein